MTLAAAAVDAGYYHHAGGPFVGQPFGSRHLFGCPWEFLLADYFAQTRENPRNGVAALAVAAAAVTGVDENGGRYYALPHGVAGRDATAVQQYIRCGAAVAASLLLMP